MKLQNDGVFARYAIGGAMAATFYVEPLLTFDLDVFVLCDTAIEQEHDVPGSRRVDCIGRVVTRSSDREIASQCVVIEGVPVQFLPAYNSLIKEALAHAREVDYEGVRTRVVRAEHLVAICLQTGRDKDRERVRLLREQAELDPAYLADLLRRHKLEEKWKTGTE